MDGPSDFNVDVSISCNFGLELVLVDDFLWNVFQWHFHALMLVQRCTEMHVFNVNAHAFAFASGEDMVPMDFDGFNVCSFSGDNSRVVCDEVSTHCDSGSVGFIFFRTDRADNARAGNSFSCWHLVFVNEEYCIGSFDSFTNALGEAAQFIGTGVEPCFLAMWIFDWVSTFHLFSSLMVSDCHATVNCHLFVDCFPLSKQGCCFCESFGEESWLTWL